MDNFKKMDLAEMSGLELKQTNGGASCDKHEQCNPESAEEAGEAVRNALILGIALASVL